MLDLLGALIGTEMLGKQRKQVVTGNSQAKSEVVTINPKPKIYGGFMALRTVGQHALENLVVVGSETLEFLQRELKSTIKSTSHSL